MKNLILFTIGILLLNSVYADIPVGYYDSANGLSEEALESALHNIIDNHTVKTYGEARYILDESDVDPDNSANVILIYTGTSVSGNWDGGATWNREHVWSKSHGFPDEGEDIAYSDLHNLKPSHPTVNTNRSDKDFEEGGTQHGIATECFYTDDTWEPRDEVKGDVARIMFYMVVRYQGDAANEVDLELVEDITSYPDPEFGILSTLLQWHIDDPVSEFERNRNDVIYSNQNNRNPFIDHPEYVSKIWGGGYTNPAPVISNVNNIPEIPTASETVSVSATIIDDSEVTDAELHWGYISGALLNTISMTNTSGDTYETNSDIPAQTDGTTIYYVIETMDDSSGIATSVEHSYTIDNNPAATILDEDFSSCPASDWTIYTISGIENWECSSYGYATINAYNAAGTGGACDDWFISPSINLDSYSGEYLSFSSWTGYTDISYPTIKVFYSTDYFEGTNPTSYTWTELSATWPAEDSQIWTESGKIDLSGINGTSVYIAFHYTSSGVESGECAIWEIDNVLIKETANILPVISEISNTPVTPTEGTDVTVTATITDADGTISAANIKWGTVSGTYPNTVSMSGSVDDYSGIIPSQSGGSIVYYVIEATDDAPETRQSLEKIVSFNTTGNSVPVISDIILTPELPESTDDVIISATITDDGSISVAQLKWGTSTGSYPNTMNLSVSGDNYSSFIPDRPEGTHIYFVIYAVDNDGGSEQSSENDYIVNNPPTITNIEMDPATPTQNDDVTVSANISDENGTIQSAVLKYKVGSGSNTNISMYVSGSKHKGVIPMQEIGETVTFSITATDNYGGEVTSSSGSYIVADASGISDISFNEVTFYPNPANEELNISVQNYSGEINVQIYNIIGNLVYSEKSNINDNHKISLSEIDSGIYFVKITYGNFSNTQKIIIKK
jgi:endonuclease I